MPLVFGLQCPICGELGSGRSLSSHYRTVHPDFFIQYQFLNRRFSRISLGIILASLVSIPLLVIGLFQIAILPWGLLLVIWFAYTLFMFQRNLDVEGDRYLDEWTNQGKRSSVGEIATGPTRKGGTPIVCPICRKGPFRLGLGLRYHTRIAHPDYFSWYARWVRDAELTMMLMGVILLFLGVTGILPLNTPIGPVFVGPVLLVVAIFAANRSRKQRGWRRNYLEKN